MRKSAKIIGTILIVLSTNPLFGQDIHFSQYFNSPLSLNPAETGNFEGDWRVVANYRDQWRAVAIPYKTVSASYDQQFTFKKQHFSPGIYFVNDNSGSPYLNNFKVYGSLAYHKDIENKTFSAGMQIGYVYQSLDFGKLTFPSNYNNTSGEFESGYGDLQNQLAGSNHDSYLDINVGASWKQKINQFTPEVGISIFHLNHPKESFFNSTNSRLPLRTTIHAAVQTSFSRNLYIKPGIMFSSMRGTHDMMIGSQAGMTIDGNQFNVKEVYAALYMRNGLIAPVDAFMIMAGAQVRNITMNISYDINVSGLNAYSNHRGAFELSLIIKNVSAIIKTFTIPCERI